MAENFYSMQEAMDKLRKTEAEVQGLVKQGKLRQYMDAGKPVYKVQDVDALAEEIVGLDLSTIGINLEEDLEPEATAGDVMEMGSELDLELEETAEIQLEPDETAVAPKKPKPAPEEDMDIKLQPESEGGFGLSQMGDLTMADTNVGTVGINILSGTEDAYKLTEDTKAETQAPDSDELEEIESLDADANLESFGSGSGLLDLSLQADDTSLGAVLDDILPAGAEGLEQVPEQAGLMDEGEDLLAEPEPMAQPAAEVTAPMGPADMSSPAVMPGVGQMVAIAPVDPKTNLFGIGMFFIMVVLIIAGIVMTAAIQGVRPSLVTMLIETEVAGLGMFWIVFGAAAVLAILFCLFGFVGSGDSSGSTGRVKVKKEKKAKPQKEKKKKKR